MGLKESNYNVSLFIIIVVFVGIFLSYMDNIFTLYKMIFSVLPYSLKWIDISFIKNLIPWGILAYASVSIIIKLFEKSVKTLDSSELSSRKKNSRIALYLVLVLILPYLANTGQIYYMNEFGPNAEMDRLTDLTIQYMKIGLLTGIQDDYFVYLENLKYGSLNILFGFEMNNRQAFRDIEDARISYFLLNYDKDGADTYRFICSTNTYDIFINCMLHGTNRRI